MSTVSSTVADTPLPESVGVIRNVVLAFLGREPALLGAALGGDFDAALGAIRASAAALCASRRKETTN